MSKKKSIITRYWGNHKLVFNLDKLKESNKKYVSRHKSGTDKLSDDVIDHGNPAYWDLIKRVI